MNPEIVPAFDIPMQITLLDKSGLQEVILDKQGTNIEVVGRFTASGTEKKEIQLRVVHKARNTKSTISIRGVVRDAAYFKFSGTIVVEKAGQKTESFLKEEVLLLSTASKAEAVPNLEIHANDVKCSHASTISKINEDQLFYLMSRGLSRTQAELEIVNGFLHL